MAGYKTDDTSNVRPGYVFVYLCTIALVFVCLSLSSHVAWSITKNNASLSLSSPSDKLAHLKANSAQYDLILWGDSRTYIGIDPDIVAEETGLPTFNYGSMAHWFPTQYPQLQKMLPHLKNKKVVWTIGRINFNVLDAQRPEVNTNTSLSIRQFFEYINIGYHPKVLIDNVLQHYLPSRSLIFRKDKIQEKSSEFLAAPSLVQIATQPEKAPESQADVERIAMVEQLLASVTQRYPDSLSVGLVNGDEMDNVLIDVARSNGQRVHVEVEPEYLRSRQKYFAETSGPVKPINALPESLFYKMVDLFAANEIELIVVEYRDAPYQTKQASVRQIHRSDMDKYKAYVEAHGFQYIVPDMSALLDDHYFDYNHLNEEGSRIYSKMLGASLAKLVK